MGLHIVLYYISTACQRRTASAHGARSGECRLSGLVLRSTRSAAGTLCMKLFWVSALTRYSSLSFSILSRFLNTARLSGDSASHCSLVKPDGGEAQPGSPMSPMANARKIIAAFTVVNVEQSELRRELGLLLIVGFGGRVPFDFSLRQRLLTLFTEALQSVLSVQQLSTGS